MTSRGKTAVVFGGTGFVGRHIVKRLAAEGCLVKVVTRIPEQAYFLKPYGNVGQIVPCLCNYDDPASLREMVAGANFVVNCLGILYEKRRNKFRRIHIEIPARIAEACVREGVERFVHISALGVDVSKSRYAASKMEGERAVLSACPWATILRPSVVFGPEDQFFNLFAGLAQFAPALPLIGGGRTKFQPIYVGDVALAVLSALLKPAIGDDDPRSKTFELGGPDVVSFLDIYKIILKYTARRRLLLPVPFFAAKIKAFFLSLMPHPLLTPDQVESLKTDNVVSLHSRGLADLGIVPTGMSLVVPSYLEIYKAGGRFADKKAA